jgi:hypothetical protein
MLINGTDIAERSKGKEKWRSDEIRQQDAILVVPSSSAIAADERAAGLLTWHLSS